MGNVEYEDSFSLATCQMLIVEASEPHCLELRDFSQSESGARPRQGRLREAHHHVTESLPRAEPQDSTTNGSSLSSLFSQKVEGPSVTCAVLTYAFGLVGFSRLRNFSHHPFRLRGLELEREYWSPPSYSQKCWERHKSLCSHYVLLN